MCAIKLKLKAIEHVTVLYSGIFGDESDVYRDLNNSGWLFDDKTRVWVQPDELTAARAEIARLTAELAASEQARKVADAGWSECMEEVDNLLREIDILKTDSGIPF